MIEAEAVGEWTMAVSQMMEPLFEGGPGPLIVVVIFLRSWNCRDLTDKEHRGTFVSHDQKLSPASRSQRDGQRSRGGDVLKTIIPSQVNDAEWPIACVARVC